MKLVKAALVATMLLPASGAFAQDDSLGRAQFQVGLSMLEVNAQNALEEYNIDANVQDLSLAQLAQILGILNDPDANTGGNDAGRRISAIVNQ